MVGLRIDLGASSWLESKASGMFKYSIHMFGSMKRNVKANRLGTIGSGISMTTKLLIPILFLILVSKLLEMKNPFAIK